MKELLQYESVYEASEDLVEPTRRVVGIAMQKVRQGKVDTLGRQKIMLRNEAARKIFEVTDVDVELTSGKVESEGLLDGGLFVYEFILNKNELTPKSGIEIQIPRSVDAVNSYSIFLLRGINPKQINQLADELFTSTICD